MFKYNIYDLSVNQLGEIYDGSTQKTVETDIDCESTFYHSNPIHYLPSDNCDNATDSDYGLNMFQMDKCLTNAINHYTQHLDLSYNTSNTRRNNWVSLYNEQYLENTELVVGIVVISIILAKMIFFPIKIKM